MTVTLPVEVSYARSSAVEEQPGGQGASVALAGNLRRPVRFRARVRRGVFLLRVALRALGGVVWSDDTWRDAAEVLDPVVTVHPDCVFLEAFSQDQSSYGRLVIDRDLFEPDGEVVTGTTNIDFTAWLYQALEDLRGSRETWLSIEAGGVEVRTVGAAERFERKVDLPLPWVRGFVNLQGAMAMPGMRLGARPVDVLSIIRHLKKMKAKVSPRALRYELVPGEDARAVLEPWEQAVVLKGAAHERDETRVIRTWGRRRLRLIEPLLPFAERVDVYLKGRALPTFYAVRMEGMTFILGLSGWSGQQWTAGPTFELLMPPSAGQEARVAEAGRLLAREFRLDERALGALLGVGPEEALRLLVRLCRQGRAVYDLERRAFLHRELFEAPLDEARVFPPDERQERARALLADADAGRVLVEGCEQREKVHVRKRQTAQGTIEPREIIHRDWHVRGRVDGLGVEVVVNDTGRMIFGTCECGFFKEHLMSQGPCEHLLALFGASEGWRKDGAASRPAAESVGAVGQPRVGGAGQPPGEDGGAE